MDSDDGSITVPQGTHRTIAEGIDARVSPLINEDGTTTREKRTAYRDGYSRLHTLLTVLGLLVGGLASVDVASVRAGCTEGTDTALRDFPGALLAGGGQKTED